MLRELFSWTEDFWLSGCSRERHRMVSFSWQPLRRRTKTQSAKRLLARSFISFEEIHGSYFVGVEGALDSKLHLQDSTVSPHR